jgi:hypothetical protein
VWDIFPTLLWLSLKAFRSLLCRRCFIPSSPLLGRATRQTEGTGREKEVDSKQLVHILTEAGMAHELQGALASSDPGGQTVSLQSKAGDPGSAHVSAEPEGRKKPVSQFAGRLGGRIRSNSGEGQIFVLFRPSAD